MTQKEKEEKGEGEGEGKEGRLEEEKEKEKEEKEENFSRFLSACELGEKKLCQKLLGCVDVNSRDEVCFFFLFFFFFFFFFFLFFSFFSVSFSFLTFEQFSKKKKKEWLDRATPCMSERAWRNHPTFTLIWSEY